MALRSRSAGREHLGCHVAEFVIFRLDGARHGLPLAAAERVLPMVAVTRLPMAPDVVLGVISLHGEPVPVVDVRLRLGLAPREYGVGAHLFIASTPRRRLCLPVDEVLGVEEIDPKSVAKADTVVPGFGPVAGIASLPNGLFLIHDLDAFLSLEDELRLAQALAAR